MLACNAAVLKIGTPINYYYSGKCSHQFYFFSMLFKAVKALIFKMH